MFASLDEISNLEKWVHAQPSNVLLDEINSLGKSIETNPTKISTTHSVIIRFLDLLISALAIIFLFPFLLLVALIIRLDSPGNPIFSQMRWGKNNRKITIYKFRSMYVDLGDKSGARQVVDNDVRVTRVGGFLRKTSVDELPQIFNVLTGKISLAGPRVHPIKMFANRQLYEDFSDKYFTRHHVKPGITGLAQCAGFRGQTTEAKDAAGRLYCDLYFVKNYSLKLYFVVLIYTAFKIIRLKL